MGSEDRGPWALLANYTSQKPVRSPVRNHSGNHHGNARLLVHTSRKAETWWNPEYWSIARPTDFCFGDCVWGLENQPVPLSVVDWMTVLYRREELEYSLPDDEEPYKAAPINRFRTSWYDIHLTSSFWRVTETSKSVHTFLKTPGAYGYARACAQITPSMLEEIMLKLQQSGGKTSLQSILKDKDLPQQVRVAIDGCFRKKASRTLCASAHPLSL